MKISATAAAFLVSVSIQPALAQTTCTEAAVACQKPQDTNRCDVVCKAYCSKEKKACLKTGNFTTKHNRWTALEKK